MFKDKTIKTPGSLGYTLVEMTVVMGIVALLSVLGASALLASRDQAIVSDATENVLSLIREAQNRSISVTSGKNTGASKETKVWGILIDNTATTGSASLIYLDTSALNTTSVLTVGGAEDTFTARDGVTIKTELNSQADTANRYIFYSTPFGKPSFATQSFSGAAAAPLWQESNTPSKNWTVSGASSALYSESATDSLTITIKFKEKTQNIIVKGGDAYVK